MVQIRVFRCNFIEENCYILWDDTAKEACWVVDCGAFYPQEVQFIADFMEKEGLRPVRHLLTHGHFDHIFGAKAIWDRYGVAPTLLREELETYEKAPEQMRLLIREGFDFEVPVAGELLQDGDELKLGQYLFRVIATPGHTPGGACYYCAEEGILLSGDTLFRHSYGRTDLPGGNFRQLSDSLERLMRLPEDTRVLPGHGPETRIGEESGI